MNEIVDKNTSKSKNSPVKRSTVSQLNNQPRTQNYTVQASIVLKTPIFVPVGRSSDRPSHQISENSKSLRHLNICKKYGYDQVHISGEKLSLEVDFKIWAGCLRAIHHYGQKSNIIHLPFREFVVMCGYGKHRIKENFRRMIEDSFGRIASLNMVFKKQRLNDGDPLKIHYTSLLKSATIDEESDFVELEIDSKLWDLYQIDHEILVSMQNLAIIGRSETAQCLYLYLASLPSSPHPISMERLRERMELSGTVTNQNKRIKAAFEKLVNERLVKGYFRGRGDSCNLHLTSITRKFRDSTLTSIQSPEFSDAIDGEYRDLTR